jgi:hypothetical protein
VNLTRGFEVVGSDWKQQNRIKIEYKRRQYDRREENRIE